MTTKTTRVSKAANGAAERALPPALAALAARIDEKAHVDARAIHERIANSLQALMERTGATPEVLAEVIGMLDQEWPEKGQSKVLVDHARGKIIAELIKIESQTPFNYDNLPQQE